MRKFVCLLLVLLMTSGCCELFGLCTSVNVHTQALSPDNFAGTEIRDGLMPANLVVGNQLSASDFPACG
jgi:hypothetical protein